MDTSKYGTCALLFAVLGAGGWVLHDVVAPAPAGGRSVTAMPERAAEDPAPLGLTITPPDSPPVRVRLVPVSSVSTDANGPRPAAGSAPTEISVWPGSSDAAAPSRDGRAATGKPALTRLVLVPSPGRPAHETSPGKSTSHAAAGHQVLASAGSIVFIGANGRLTANTGRAGSSGVVALGTTGSTLRSGGSTTPAAGPGTAAPSGSPHANGSFLSLLPQGASPDGRSIAISGFEDHSVSVVGDDQLVTYDDSNVFIARNGQINANTGDTDSSGLNAVDVVGSLVRSGNSGDGEGDGEAEEDEEEEGTAAEEPDQGLAVDRLFAQLDEPGDPEATDDTDGPDEDGVPPIVIPPGGTYGTVTDEGASIATGRSSFVVGADGYDDVSVRSQGHGNIVTYDDSNVVIGGSGKVNAQIGDSDTGGAVVMGIYNSNVQAGCEGDLCYPK